MFGSNPDWVRGMLVSIQPEKRGHLNFSVDLEFNRSVPVGFALTVSVFVGVMGNFGVGYFAEMLD